MNSSRSITKGKLSCICLFSGQRRNGNIKNFFEKLKNLKLVKVQEKNGNFFHHYFFILRNLTQIFFLLSKIFTNNFKIYSNLPYFIYSAPFPLFFGGALLFFENSFSLSTSSSSSSSKISSSGSASPSNSLSVSSS